MSAYDELMAFQRETEALEPDHGRLSWDQETVMPSGAGEQRARKSPPSKVSCTVGAPNPASETGLKRRARKTKCNVGSRVDSPKLRTQPARSRGAFCGTRANRIDFAARMGRGAADGRLWHVRADAWRGRGAGAREGAALADGGNLYDALLDGFEPEMTEVELDRMFGALRPRLVNLRDRIMGSERMVPELDHDFDESGQLRLSAELAEVFGYDRTRGRIDKAVHPFSSGSGLDVRITMRTDARDPFNCIYSTIHEAGHACYEQGIDRAYLLTPLGDGVSTGVHESQSRIYENQIGPQQGIHRLALRRMRDIFGDFGIADEDSFFATVNRFSSGFIRTEADEVDYNLHVLLRFDLERDLVNGRLEAVMQVMRGTRDSRQISVSASTSRPMVFCRTCTGPRASWAIFPTYTLGNVYAGCLHAAMKREVSGLGEALAEGETEPARRWLGERIHRFGGLLKPRDLMERAIGEAPSEAPLLDYLDAKFGEIYCT